MIPYTTKSPKSAAHLRSVTPARSQHPALTRRAGALAAQEREGKRQQQRRRHVASSKGRPTAAL